MLKIRIQTKDSQLKQRCEKSESLMFVVKSLIIFVKRRLSRAIIVSVSVRTFEKVFAI